MNSQIYFEEEIIKSIRQDIEQARGQEVYLIGNIDKNSKMVIDYNLMARGNYQAVPAIINDLRPGQVLIHNHPSGDLTPSAADIRLASRVGNRGIGFAIIDNQVAEVYEVVKPKFPDEETLLEEGELVELFQKSGKLSANLENYEYRSQQINVLKEIINSFNNSQFNFIEAGTGTGKSFAYLVPALYWAHRNQQPVVVSTNTINLQEQLINKDLVFLKKVLDFEFKSVLVKGRSNYLCKRKLNYMDKYQQDVFERDPDKAYELTRVREWADHTRTGNRSELKFMVSPEVWERVASESDLCINSRCPFFDSCFFMQARKEIYSADILIVNHHLLLSDANLKTVNGSLLPEYRHLIVDEAHNLNDIATKHLGLPFNFRILKKFLNRLEDDSFSLIPRLRNGLGRLDLDNKQKLLNQIDSRIKPRHQSIEELGLQFFQKLEEYFEEYSQDSMLRLTGDSTDNRDWRQLVETGEQLTGLLNNLGIALNDLYRKLSGLQEQYLEQLDDRIIELEMAMNSCQQLINALEFNLSRADDNYVFWLEKRGKAIKQKNAPLNIASLLQEILWEKMDNLVLTSATLTVNGSFDYFKSELGLKKSQQLQVDSPFDYSKQASLLIPTEIPPPNSNSFLKEITGDLARMLVGFSGSTMVLFTSYRMLNYCVENIEPRLENSGITLLPQGRFPRNYILNNFKENSGRIIFGTVSFWEGVDIKGNDLRYLVIMKLPFPVPTRPVAAARMEQLKKEGKNPFFNYSIPRAVIRFKQGFGRLIRSRKDRGVIVNFDNRLINKSYGRIFINSLPGDCPIRETSLTRLVQEANSGDKALWSGK